MILFFYGQNSYAARAKLGELKAQYVAKNGNDFGLDQLDGESIKLGDLMQQFQAVPFLANSRLIIVENLGRNKVVSEAVLERLDEVPESTIVVLYDPDVDKRGRYFKTLSKLPRAVEFKPLSPPALIKWIEDTTVELGARIDRAAMQELINRCGDDQWRLTGELTKLAAFDTTITRDKVAEMVEPSEEQNVFAFLDSVMAGNRAAALSGLHTLQRLGQNEMYILTMILWQLRQVLMASLSGLTNSNELAREAGMSPFAAGKALALASKTSREQLADYYSKAVATERGIKTGQTQPDELLEALVIQLCA